MSFKCWFKGRGWLRESNFWLTQTSMHARTPTFDSFLISDLTINVFIPHPPTPPPPVLPLPLSISLPVPLSPSLPLSPCPPLSLPASPPPLPLSPLSLPLSPPLSLWAQYCFCDDRCLTRGVCFCCAGVRDARGWLRLRCPQQRISGAQGIQNPNRFPRHQRRRTEPKPVAVPEAERRAEDKVSRLL